ncbi:MAG: histone deacetylase family protein [Acidimicrobiales bacterium]
MSVLIETHPSWADHDAGAGHPERPERLGAVWRGIEAAGLAEAVVAVGPRPATRAELERVHSPAHLDSLAALCAAGGGRIDADTAAGPRSWEAAVLAAGAGLDAVERLERGEADAAFLAMRPPGHHATPGQAMGFCLLNHVAITAAALADRGEKVLIVDWDAHHGNGTQDAFWNDGRVIYASMHQYPWYPGSGRAGDTGGPGGRGATINVPFPEATTGDAYLAAFDELVVPAAERAAVGWVLVSAGFDAHRADPLARLGLSAGDFADLTARVVELAMGLTGRRGRVVAFLEGGYDLDALAASAGACIAALAGESWRPERATAGGPGRAAVDAAIASRPA